MISQIPETLFGLVSCYSPSGQEEPAVANLLKRMAALGYDQTFQDAAGNAVGIIGKGPRQIILLGHIDTVPGKIPIRVEDGFLFARGSVDAKGPLAAFTDAAALTGEQKDWQIIVIGAVGEEADSQGARFLVDRYRPEMVVIGEPSAWDRITIGYKGCAHARITVQCEASHTANGEQTACEIAAQIWQAVLQWTADYNGNCNRRFEELQNSLLNWSFDTDGFNTWATLSVASRLPVSFHPDAWMKKLQDLAGEENVHSTGFSVQAYRGEKNSPLVRSFLKSIREIEGKPGFVVKTGTADMNIVAPAWQCPAVAYGPGDSSLDHTPNEHLSLEEYDKAVQVLHKVLVELTSNK